MLKLHSYQQTIINATRSHLLAGRHSVLIASPTGSGKTCLAAHMIRGASERGKRTWFCCHRSELVDQSIETLETAAGLQVGVIAAGFGANPYPLAQVCSIQTLMRRWQKYPLPDLLILDEAHHCVSKSWNTLITEIRARKPAIKIIGLSATPQRTDQRGLGEHFEVMVQGPTVRELTAQGFLSKYKLFAPSMANLSSVHTVAGDYSQNELDEAMRGSTVTGDALNEYRTRCAGKRALMFLWSVRASEQMAEVFNAAGIPAAHIDGNTERDTRRRAVQDFKAGRIKVLTNCQICTEGFDTPACDAVFLLRPTQSLILYLQMIGRGLRVAEGKGHVLLLDHSGNWQRHGLPDSDREWSLDGAAGRSKAVQKHPVRQCVSCYFVMKATARKCPNCGSVFDVEPRTVNQEAGELAEIDMAAAQRLLAAKNETAQRRIEQGRAQSYNDLLAIEKQRGYKPGWALHIHEARSRKTRDRWEPRSGDGVFSMAAANRPKGK